MLVAGFATLGVLLHNAQHRENTLSVRLRSAQADAAAARQSASSRYNAGFTAGQNLNTSLGLTYPKGYKDGWQAAFAGFNGWTDGNWYLVKIEHGANGHNISSRFDITPCERMYMSNDELFTSGYAC